MEKENLNDEKIRIKKELPLSVDNYEKKSLNRRKRSQVRNTINELEL